MMHKEVCMADRTVMKEMEHYMLVTILAESLRKGGFSEIEADHITTSSPPHPIYGEGGSHIPDLVASKNGKKYIFEVETDDSLLENDTEEEIVTFYQYAKEIGGEFCIFVPERSTAKADYLLNWLKLEDVPILYS
jgi:hypothetical protein